MCVCVFRCCQLYLGKIQWHSLGFGKGRGTYSSERFNGHCTLHLTNRAAVKVNNTLRFPSFISEHRLIFLVLYHVFVPVSLLTTLRRQESVAFTRFLGKKKGTHEKKQKLKKWRVGDREGEQMRKHGQRSGFVLVHLDQMASL